ncbi:hypothetical protein ACG10_22845 (plasmid) [Azotobacter chroococcum]|nr:hypothetical protein ACG10_22845 [Azotobacter chroococcum]
MSSAWHRRYDRAAQETVRDATQRMREKTAPVREKREPRSDGAQQRHRMEGGRVMKLVYVVTGVLLVLGRVAVVGYQVTQALDKRYGTDQE